MAKLALVILLAYSNTLWAISLKATSKTYETKEEGLPIIPFQTVLLKGAPGDFNIGYSYSESFEKLEVKNAPKMPCRCSDDDRPDYNFKKQDQREHYKLEMVGDYRGEAISKLTFYPYSFRSETYANELKITRFDKQVVRPFMMKQNSSTKMLLVLPKEWEDQFDSYISWRESQGVEIFKYAFDEITPEQLKNEVKKFYQQHQINYLWLIGDEDVITPYYIETSNDVRTPSDLPFVVMGGADDFVPDMFYGRLPISRIEQIKPFLLKLKNYERSLDQPQNIIGMASDEGSNPTDEEYLEQMIAPLRDELGFHESVIHQSSETGDKQAVINSFERGAAWVNYIGHGIGNAWPSLHRSEFNTTDVSELSAAPMLPVIIDVACQNGRFSREGRLGERFLNDQNTINPKGAVAYYGGSVDVSWHPPAIMAVGINQELAALKNFNQRLSLGELVFRGQMRLLETYDVTQSVRENFVWYHLLGDPLLNVRH